MAAAVLFFNNINWFFIDFTALLCYNKQIIFIECLNKSGKEAAAIWIWKAGKCLVKL